jgi:sugar phosphate isomerase/epimerase
MAIFKIGVMSDCFRLGAFEGVRKAAELGADGVQIWTTAGEMAPEAMDTGKRAEFKTFVADSGLELASLCGDIGAYSDPAENEDRVARQKLILDLAADLGTAVVTSHIGVVPDEPNDEVYRTLHAALSEIGSHAVERGVTFAIETGPERGSVLKTLLDDVGSPGVAVNLDPANLVMVAGDDPVDAVQALGEYIVHTHAKDGVMTPGKGHAFEELPLGQGGVKWDAYLAALEASGFSGYLTIEREVGDDPGNDIAMAIEFLRSQL